MKKQEYVGFWMRVVAYLLDGVILGMPTLALSWLLVEASGITALQYIVNIAVIVLIIWMDGIKGGTPGKLLLGMRIVNEQGDYIGIPRAIVRYIGKIISGLILGIGYIMIAFTAKKQGLHDMIAKTYVVKK